MAEGPFGVGAFASWLEVPVDVSYLRIQLASVLMGFTGPLIAGTRLPFPARVLPLLVLFGAMAAARVESVQTGEAFDAARVRRDQGNYLREVTAPSWLETATPPSAEEFPSRARLKVTVEGKELILELKKNKQLLAPDYTETHYSRSGTPVVSRANLSEHCYYHGAVRGLKRSHVVLSACSGFSGLISLRSNLSYMLEPLAGDRGLHVIYRTEHLRFPQGTCGHQHPEALPEHWARAPISAANSGHHRVRREDLDSRKYVELYLVADHAEFQKHEYDLGRTKQKMVEVANYIDKFYKSLNIRVALVGLEVWTDGNKCNVTENPYSTLWSFLSWRRKLLSRKKHDNAQLITGRAFQGTTIGLAPLLAMCSVYQSGGVNMDHSDNSVGIASTMAHEMGHNFGMSHDASGCCTASAAEGGCIMAAATGHPFPKVFNECNRKQLERYLQTGGGMCLSNLPDTSSMYGGSRCGNGYLEDGEECDCGEAEECTNPCCNASTCTLRHGAECAHGTCCQQCRLRASGTLCRKESRPCDLPEFCTGKSAFCPPNSYQLDGTSCQQGRAYCYSGMCLTHHQQCSQLWGPGSRTAPEVCFQKVNAAGDSYGNCGKDTNGQYRACAASDAKCGKIQCMSSASKPLDSNAVAIDTTVSLEGKRIRCRGTHVYRTTEEVGDSLQTGDILDPGLVMTGTKCGDNHICFEGQCRSVAFFQAEECAAKCHGRGMCNNNRNCHCSQGWDPPFCNHTGRGGSIDSGPPPPGGSGAVVFGALTLALLLILLPGAVLCLYVYRRKEKRKPPRGPHASQQDAEQPSGNSDPSPNKGTGHSNPTYRLQPPSVVSGKTDCPGGLSAPGSQPQPITENVLQPTTSSACDTHAPAYRPQEEGQTPACGNPGSLNQTDSERATCPNAGTGNRTSTVKQPAQESEALLQHGTVKRFPVSHPTLHQSDIVVQPTPTPEAMHQTEIQRWPSATLEASRMPHPQRHTTQIPAAVHQNNADKPPCLSPGALQRTEPLKGSALSKGTLPQIDAMKKPHSNPGGLHRTGAMGQPPLNSRTSERDPLLPTAQNTRDTTRHAPPRKAIPPAPQRPSAKQSQRSDPPKKPLPPVPSRGPNLKKSRTRSLAPTVGRQDSKPGPGAEPGP
ncbi:disintegrin and metalloproteinase domain-containing protein 19 isoform X2 [Ambystoma mexicanum]|uniref:disintegrin and metalloproteinase domain-containing protein 19 isoform X2 n=1 Tax=Ambystoma mexicanum TaxID=8296 RepID=UPI0037E7725E